MGTLSLKYKRGKDQVDFLTKRDYAKFGVSILGIGDVSNEGVIRQSASAIFDLEGFTDFCNQIDPHLVVPEFLKGFLTWLFDILADEFTMEKTENEVKMWCQLPFFAKFMGDGVLFLWDTKGMDKKDLSNLVVSLYEVCQSYQTKFLPGAQMNFAKPPKRLRCGIARGQVVALGDGRDYVGACINVASRIQKLSNLSFAFSRRGFDLATFGKDWKNDFLLVQAPIRGIGDKDPVYVVRSEFEALSPEYENMFEV